MKRISLAITMCVLVLTSLSAPAQEILPVASYSSLPTQLPTNVPPPPIPPVPTPSLPSPVVIPQPITIPQPVTPYPGQPVMTQTFQEARVTKATLKPWVQSEFLMWWMKDTSLPALVTTSTSQASLGVLGAPDTSILYGGRVDGDLRLGGRFTAGIDAMIIDNNCNPVHCGMEVVYFFLEANNNSFMACSAGNPVLARPFFNVLNNQQFSEQVANLQIGNVPPGPGPRPGFARAFTGSIAIDNYSRVWGGEVNGTWDAILGLENLKCRGLLGFRHFGLEEDLSIREDLALPATLDLTNNPVRVVLPETAITIIDQFKTRNYFYGPQLGFKSQWRRGLWSLDVIGKLALGWMDQSVEIRGSNVNTVRDAVTGQFLTPTTGQGGLLAQPTNIGKYNKTAFAYVPEVTVNLGCDLTECMRVFVGYNFLYVSNVVRPGDQIDTGVDFRGRAGGTTPADAVRPAFAFNNTDFWLQGIQVGFNLRY